MNIGKDTYCVKQATVGGADTVVTTKRPDLTKAKECHAELSRTRKPYFHTATDSQQPVARLDQSMFVIKKMVKERDVFQHSRSEDQYTHAHVFETATQLSRDPNRDLDEYSTVCVEGVETHDCTHVLQRCHALRDGTHSCLRSASFFLVQTS